ncbi:uncharacterized protein N7498_007859 [Penicillium cinerascens]|uniref:Uncharacterized protein n=1 Tax=Penicillium cinerascens TaxID=70096 RepID=A0A9W9MFM7_9EURO|nr:uncharacterized protein N7498_007859 [Penicillium cinerascens]KAJ5198742.1 hypothetical protein N7498_007859 [Penicillium cinerascens]
MNEREDNHQIVSSERDIPGATTQPLGLTRPYAQNWSSHDAFRELYQNWKDSIIQNHGLSLLGFCPTVTETNQEILIVVPKPNTDSHISASLRDCAGYITFKKHSGVVELTNFHALLDRKCLDLGYTTKTNDDRLTGGHGEGLKIAALVLSRNNYHVKICANSCYWNFGFRGKSNRNFYCQITPTSVEKIKRLKLAFETSRKSSSRKFTANIWEDVSICIKKGDTSIEHALTKEEFWHWLQVTIDVNPPANLVRTLAGDLILDDKYSGCLFLRGIKVLSADMDDRGFRVGYNLATGDLSRDRSKLHNPEQESKAIAEIWASAIEQGHQKALSVYVYLLQHHPHSRDVRGADQLVNEATARKIWTELKAQTGKAKNSKDVATIRKDLKKKPQALSSSLWQLLHQYNLVHTPDEELQRLFEVSNAIKLPKTRFAQEIDRALRALFIAIPRTQSLRIVYVTSDDEKTSVVFAKESNILYVHEKWLDISRAHLGVECLASTTYIDDSDGFFCEHVVEEIFHRALALIYRPLKLNYLSSPLEDSPHIIFQTSRGKLQDMPRGIRTETIENKSLKVLWDDGHSRAFSRAYGLQVEYIVILHLLTCFAAMETLLFREKDILCECPRKYVSQMQGFAIFTSLDGEPRFPMVARHKDEAIFGFPPLPLARLEGDSEMAVEVSNAMIPLAESSIQGLGSVSRAGDDNVKSETQTAQELKIETAFSLRSAEADPTLPIIAEAHPELSISVDGTRGQAMEESIINVDDCKTTKAEGYCVWKKEMKGHRIDAFNPKFNIFRSQSRPCTPIEGPFQRCDEIGDLKKNAFIEATYEDPSPRSRCVFYIHDILVREDGDSESAIYLIASRYTFLCDNADLRQGSSSSWLNNELLLHFNDFNLMSKSADGELILMKDMSSWKSSPAIEHTAKAPGFSAPDVLDFSPTDVGLSVGLSEAGCNIKAGIAFCSGHSDAWKRFHPHAEIYDSPTQFIDSVLNETQSTAPLVIAASGMPNDHYSLSSLTILPDEVLAPLKLKALFDSVFLQEPDFVFLELHSIVLNTHISDLVNSILALLGQRYSVELRLVVAEIEPDKRVPIIYLLAAPAYFQSKSVNEMAAELAESAQWRPAFDMEHGPQAKALDDMTIGPCQCAEETESLPKNSGVEPDQENKAKELARGKGFPSKIVDRIQARDYDEVLRSLPSCISKHAGASIFQFTRESGQQIKKRRRSTSDVVPEQPFMVKRLKEGESGTPD